MQRIATVIEPAASLLLVDLATVKDELGIAASDTSQDARLNRYIAQVSSQIHSYLDRIIPVQTYRNLFRPVQAPHGWDYWRGGWRLGAAPLILSEAPTIEILGVEEDANAVDPEDFEADLARGEMWRLYGTPFRRAWWSPEIVVDFRAGYDPVPADIQAAALRLVTIQSAMFRHNPFLRSREGPTYGREEFFTLQLALGQSGLPPDVQATLDGYARPLFQ